MRNTRFIYGPRAAGRRRGPFPSPVGRARPVLHSIVLLCLLLSACAVSRDRQPGVMEASINEPDVADLKIRHFLFEALTGWEEVRVAWDGGEETGDDENSPPQVRQVLETEFSKFFDNAVLLYLRGDWSTDLDRSMHTVKEIVLNGGSITNCGAGKSLAVPGIDAYVTGGITPPDSGERAFLYRVRSYWDEMNSRLSSRHVLESIPADDVQTLQELNQRFMEFYPQALRVFLEGKPDRSEVTAAFDRLRAVTSEARAISDRSGGDYR